jgi:hypothetical protein
MEKERITKDEARRRLRCLKDNFNIFSFEFERASTKERLRLGQENIMIESITDKRIDMKFTF